jgi:integrase
MLTDTALRQIKPASKPQFLFDSGGLYLQVAPAGGKWWRYKYRFQGKQKLLALGVYPDVSLRDARERHAAARRLLAQGIDPSAERKEGKRESKTRISNSFAALAEAWYTKKSAEWAPSTADKARFYLDSDLIPALGARPIAEIRRTELVEALAEIEERDALDVAKKCRGWLSGIFRYALALGVLEINPATDLDVVAKPMPRRRQLPHLPLAELSGFLIALAGYRGESVTTIAIRLLLLTAVRPGELRAARWDEFDLDAGLWRIPAERMKMRRAHTVPLPAQAVTILRGLQSTGIRRELVFPSRDDPRQPMSENTVNLAIHRIGYKGKQTGHGFRHLVSTALNERGYNRDWIERQLAHGDENEIRAVYNKAEYLDQRRDMMQAWADYLDALKRGESKVVPLRAAYR